MNMRYFLLALIFISFNAKSADWVILAIDDEATTLVDKNSLKYEINDNRVQSFQFWLKVVYKKPLFFIDASKKKKYDTTLSLQRVYCLENKYELLSGMYRLKNDPVLSREFSGRSEFIKPDSAVDVMATANCNIENLKKEPDKIPYSPPDTFL